MLIVHWYIHPNLQALHPNLESVHGLDGRLGAGGVVEADEAEALALVGGAVDEHLGVNDDDDDVDDDDDDNNEW